MPTSSPVDVPDAEAEPTPAHGTLHEQMPTRELLRMLRVPSVNGPGLPESGLWRAYIELQKRGEAGVGETFIEALRALHRRRGFARADIAVDDPQPDEHRLAADPYLGELWKSYKRCVCTNRHGPAGQLLRELEKQIR
jgi:hypothetical protein